MSNALTDAAAKGYLSRVEAAIQVGHAVDTPDEQERTPLMLAARAGHVDVVHLLLSAGVQVNRQATYYGWTALAYAAQAGYLEIVRLLLAYGADPTVKAERGKTPLVLAADRGHAEVVAVLLESGDHPDPDPDYHGWTPLRRASRQGHREVVRVLLDAGADPGRQDCLNETPLDIALKQGHTEIADLMRSLRSQG